MPFHASPFVECPICEYPHAVLKHLMTDRFFQAASGRFQLYWCRSCGLLFQPPQEPAPDWGQYYPPGYWWRESGRLGRLERRYREWVIRHDQLDFLLRCAGPPEGKRLLDIGCGAGTFLKLAREAGFETCGWESSPEAAEIASTESSSPVSHGENDPIERGETFDVVTLFHVLEHLPDPFTYLKGLRKIMQPDSRLVVQVPNCSSYQARLLGSRWYGLDCPRHIHNFSTFSLLHLLGRAGYRLHQVRHFSLRDNAAALVSSLFPFLDPMSQRVHRRRSGRTGGAGLAVRETAYLGLLILAQPLAALEAALGRGATIQVCATRD